MTKYWPFAIAILFGSVVLLSLQRWRFLRQEDERADLVQRWRSFIEAEPHIHPARVPSVRPLVAQRQTRLIVSGRLDSRVARFGRRLAGGQ